MCKCSCDSLNESEFFLGIEDYIFCEYCLIFFDAVSSNEDCYMENGGHEYDYD